MEWEIFSGYLYNSNGIYLNYNIVSGMLFSIKKITEVVNIEQKFSKSDSSTRLFFRTAGHDN
ncbi:hypothetical protein GCM10007971_08890 [Oceanobacillus indicireducens]|uniref:Uncharacterized protein n=1 Tax=Oceanobacillus indicireducens TaxID=1004261 RepID=A0A917XV21_9BACI|nr:hypothetical protein GCM10007971_08890 [Oceanobacillus indicireducens]